jgi:hypothetical protein
MKLTKNDINYLIKSFPNVKLSYVKNIHKKVSSANIFLAIPRGQKYFAWFRHFKKYSICFIMEYDNRKRRIKNILIKNCCFDERLCIDKGTILYGTLVEVNSQPFFFIEDIYFNKGYDLKSKNNLEKLNILKNILNHEIKQVKIHHADIIFGLPIITDNREKIENKLKDIPYNIYCIQHRYLKNNNTYFNERVNIIQEYKRIFIVKAEISCDIYKLYVKNKAKRQLEEHAIAFIPSYKTSVYMNSLFRNIKENDNLDLLEESDNEEEFENIDIDKYIDTNKQIMMMCKFSHKFKSWIPIQSIKKGDIALSQDIKVIEKKYK